MLRRVLGRLGPAPVALVVLLGLVALANLWWLVAYRRGLPYNIDESGYLQRSVVYAQQLSQHGIAGLLHQWRQPDIAAPMLPILSGVARAALGLGTFGMLGTQQIFEALTALGAYLFARRFSGRWWSLLCALVVAALPGVIDAGRLYLLAEPTAALFVLVMAAQCWAGRFDSLRRALLWGVLLGLASLTRTMMIAVLVGPVVAACLRVLASGWSWRRVGNLAAAGAAALVVGGSWYWTSWSAVHGYLTQYGYGKQANQYGHSYGLWTWGWWLRRIGDAVNQDVYLPLLLVLLAAVALGAGARLGRAARHLPSALRAGTEARSRPAGAREPDGDGRFTRWGRSLAALLCRTLGERDGWSVLVALTAAYLVLSTTQNSGSYFELPLVPVAVVAMLVPIGNLGRRSRGAVAVLAVLAVVLTAADQFNLTPSAASVASVQIGPAGIAAFNASSADFSGPKLKGASPGGAYWTDCGGATVTCFYGRTTDITERYVDSYEPVSNAVVTFVERYAARFGRTPVVFFAYQGPFFNTNSVALAAQLRGIALPIGALEPAVRRRGMSLRTQLEDPMLGQPNLVLAAMPPPAGARLVGPGSGAAGLRSVVSLLGRDGFSLVGSFRLVDAQPVGVWWKDR